jgi:S1-C subfamily serine protease
VRCLGPIAFVLLLFASGLRTEGGSVGSPGGLPLLETIARVQPKMVKIYGAGGVRGMEGYQSGFLISADGSILTSWSHVLDTEDVAVILADGRKFAAKLVGADPRLEVAVLKIEATELRHFDLQEAVEVEAGTRVLAFSNLFGVAAGNEPASVQHGTISVKTRLEARRGIFDTPYNGPVYVLDVVTNNPGAAGGALVTGRGELVAMLGKELRNSLNDTWLNYAIPIREVRDSVEQIRSGKFVVRRSDESTKKPARGLSTEMLGLVLVPDVVQRTPPYVDQVVPGSPAARAGIQPDDLVVLVSDRLVQSCKTLRSELQYVDFEDKVRLTVLRADDMLELVLQPARPDGKGR